MTFSKELCGPKVGYVPVLQIFLDWWGPSITPAPPPGTRESGPPPRPVPPPDGLSRCRRCCRCRCRCCFPAWRPTLRGRDTRAGPAEPPPPPRTPPLRGPRGPGPCPTMSLAPGTQPDPTLTREKCDKDNAERDLAQPTDSRCVCPETKDPSSWVTCPEGDLIRTQPQRLPQLQTSVQEPNEGDVVKVHNSQPGLSNGNGLYNGVRPPALDNRMLSAPVAQKMHRKIQSSLSVGSDISKKSKVSAAFPQKPGSSPEDCCVHCILACLFCEFLTLCNIVLGQASCGICTSEACCCCCCCGDEVGDGCNCPCDMDCGIMDACCESSDCLEICMECCGICFPS
ncbi:myoD family inhibitor domain-containing protein [Tachyglossus aculeatus]|uniref:myoD family inhibitor domain-containing protein n=1 Tax=Tachyglossus aculeatus TaxID=9261 RepID=UPI0018F604E9|nr:myoD family inhibitor domain-containing protein [Tachyglossus aculeatus]